MEERTTPIEIEELLPQANWVRELAAQLVSDPHLSEDVAQQTLLAACQQRSSIRHLKAWLGRVVRNTAIATDRAERQRAQRERALPPGEPCESTESLVARAELLRKIVGAVLELKEPYRSTLLQRYYGERTADQIGAREGISAATVRSRLKRGVDQLRARFEVDQRADRSAWLSLLLPKLSSPAAVVSTSSALSWGIVAMNLKTLAGMLVSAGAIVAGCLWIARDQGGSNPRAYGNQAPAAAHSPAAIPTEPAIREQLGVQSEQDQVEREALPGSQASLSGRVADKLTGEPVTSFSVGLWRQLADGTSAPFRYRSEPSVWETVRNSQGIFHLSVDRSGSYQLRVQSPRHRTEQLDNLQIAVPFGVSDLQIQLDLGRSVAGRVLDDLTGLPVEAAIVGTTHGPDSKLGLLMLQGEQDRCHYDTTDLGGRFRLSGLAPDSQRIAALHEDYAEGWQQLVPGVAAFVEIRLKRGARIHGTAYDDSGQPKEGVWITLSGAEIPLERHVITGPDGSYVTPPVRPGLVELSARPPQWPRREDEQLFGFFKEWQAATVENADLQIDFGRGTNLVTWTGTVRGPDGRARPVSDILLHWMPPSYVGFTRLRGHNRHAQVDEQGRFQFRKLPIGRYGMSVRLEEEDTAPIVSEVTLDTPGFLERDIDLGLLAAPEGSGEIHGVVVDAQTELPITEGSSRFVIAYRVGLAYEGHTSYLDDQGRFRFVQLPPGDYSLNSSISHRPPARTRMLLSEGQTLRDVRIRVPVSGQLRVRLADFPDAAPRGFTVYLESDEDPPFVPGITGQIAENGSWEHTYPLQTGTWLARLVIGDQESIDKSFEIRPGSLAEITFRPDELVSLLNTVTLAGSLAWSDGEPLAQTVVRFYGSGVLGLQATARSKLATTDATGRFSVSGLRLGRWMVHAEVSEGAQTNFADLVIRAGTEDPLSLDLVVPMGSVSGSLFDRRTGLVFGNEEPQWWIHLLDERLTRSVSELQGGHSGPRFELPGVPSGDYRLGVTADGYAEFQGPVFHHPGIGNLDLGRVELDPCGLLVFEAVNTEGQLLTQVSVWTDGERVPDWQVRKLSDGKFRIARLPAGKLEFELSSEGYKTLRETLTLEPGKQAEARFVLQRAN